MNAAGPRERALIANVLHEANLIARWGANVDGEWHASATALVAAYLELRALIGNYPASTRPEGEL